VLLARVLDAGWLSAWLTFAVPDVSVGPPRFASGSRCCHNARENESCASGYWLSVALSDPAGVDIAASLARGLSQRWPMAHISEYSIVTYERKPGHWRAAISPKVLVASGLTVHSVITPDDSTSESAAKLAAEQLIKKL
jgi:hypothetical protein